MVNAPSEWPPAAMRAESAKPVSQVEPLTSASTWSSTKDASFGWFRRSPTVAPPGAAPFESGYAGATTTNPARAIAFSKSWYASGVPVQPWLKSKIGNGAPARGRRAVLLGVVEARPERARGRARVRAVARRRARRVDVRLLACADVVRGGNRRGRRERAGRARGWRGRRMRARARRARGAGHCEHGCEDAHSTCLWQTNCHLIPSPRSA